MGNPSPVDWDLTKSAVSSVLSNAVPFLGEAKFGKVDLTTLYGDFGAFAIIFWGNVQKLCALAAFFLIGLALRNQFKMK
jgi:hypothetical protein